jgi:excinuclease UvrABC ATPase subunit
MRAKEFIPAEKPRNFVAKNAKMGGAGQHKDKKKAEKQGDFKHKKDKMSMEGTLGELSSDLLGRYKKAAGAQASAADKVGDTKKADKRFSGIIKATKKQFANDEKGVAEGKSLQDYVEAGVCPICHGDMVSEEQIAEGKKDACYHKIKASSKVWPSAYASGRLVQCRKAGAANYGKGKKK